MSHALARTRRAGRSFVIVAALGLALSAVPGTAWANTTTAPGQTGTAGRPADGSVGNADNKAPAGQSVDGFVNGFDANAGYECDTNHGVGQGNPAHTGCLNT